MELDLLTNEGCMKILYLICGASLLVILLQGLLDGGILWYLSQNGFIELCDIEPKLRRSCDQDSIIGLISAILFGISSLIILLRLLLEKKDKT